MQLWNQISGGELLLSMRTLLYDQLIAPEIKTSPRDAVINRQFPQNWNLDNKQINRTRMTVAQNLGLLPPKVEAIPRQSGVYLIWADLVPRVAVGIAANDGSASASVQVLCNRFVRHELKSLRQTHFRGAKRSWQLIVCYFPPSVSTLWLLQGSLAQAHRGCFLLVQTVIWLRQKIFTEL